MRRTIDLHLEKLPDSSGVLAEAFRPSIPIERANSKMLVRLGGKPNASLGTTAQHSTARHSEADARCHMGLMEMGDLQEVGRAATSHMKHSTVSWLVHLPRQVVSWRGSEERVGCPHHKGVLVAAEMNTHTEKKNSTKPERKCLFLRHKQTNKNSTYIQTQTYKSGA